ncbi:hypothetical protein HYY75_05560 [bacterium]|nr:hypothetical protein [bacterium]
MRIFKALRGATFLCMIIIASITLTGCDLGGIGDIFGKIFESIKGLFGGGGDKSSSSSSGGADEGATTPPESSSTSTPPDEAKPKDADKDKPKDKDAVAIKQDSDEEEPVSPLGNGRDGKATTPPASTGGGKQPTQAQPPKQNSAVSPNIGILGIGPDGSTPLVPTQPSPNANQSSKGEGSTPAQQAQSPAPAATTKAGGGTPAAPSPAPVKPAAPPAPAVPAQAQAPAAAPAPTEPKSSVEDDFAKVFATYFVKKEGESENSAKSRGKLQARAALDMRAKECEQIYRNQGLSAEEAKKLGRIRAENDAKQKIKEFQDGKEDSLAGLMFRPKIEMK